MDISRQLDINETRHYRADDRAIAKMDRLFDKAAALVGELCREGRTVYYINLRPATKGKTKEGNRSDLIDFLIRNRYV